MASITENTGSTAPPPPPSFGSAFLMTSQKANLGPAWHPLLRCLVLGIKSTELLPKLIPYLGKAHLCLFGSMFLKAHNSAFMVLPYFLLPWAPSCSLRPVMIPGHEI